jgi:KipI family sensor histidine kinase inhibitor
MIDLQPLGDRAFLARFPRETDAQAWAAEVRARSISGVVDIAVAYASVGVFLDPDKIEPGLLESMLRSIVNTDPTTVCGRLIHVPVLYDGEDLADVARAVGLTEAEVVKRHGSVDYSVFAIGFLPGFPYAGYLPDSLSGLARRSSPRAKVPSGSVAIAGRQTGIYPAESPGGWRLLGRTPARIVDFSTGFFPIRAGDRLRFEPIDEGTFRARRGEPIGLVQ